MGDSACLLHGFSYASAVPNESKQGNHMHALGESISFGRFATENLSWERWSTFSHKKYVEEAERYARPGSVAQKKAFFEAHYKRIAAQRAAAALLEQENAAMAKAEEAALQNDQGGLLLSPYVHVKGDDRERMTSETGAERGNEVSESLVKKNSSLKRLDEAERGNEVSVSVVRKNSSVRGLDEAGRGNEVSVRVVKKNSSVKRLEEAERGNEVYESIVKKNSSVKRLDEVENRSAVSASESSETSQIEKPLLKKKSVDSEEVSSVMRKRNTASHHKTTRRIPFTPAKTMTPQLKRESNLNSSKRRSNVDEKRSSPKSLRVLLSLGSFKESDKAPIFTNKRNEISGLAAHSSSRPPKDCSTPFKTTAPAATTSVSTYPAATPQTENRRMKTPNPSASGRKTTGPKWHILSAVCAKSLSAYRSKLQSPSVSTPFMLRTEERAAKRKQKLEEKFNAAEVQKTQQKTLKEKAGNEFRKLSCSLCFKARPLPDFYKEREPPNNQTKKPPATQPQTAVLGKSISDKKQGTISMPPPPPPPTRLAKNRVSRNLSKKNAPNQSKFLATSLPERNTHENASPNIQQ